MALGTFVGIGSPLTGTGGAFLTLPWLMSVPITANRDIVMNVALATAVGPPMQIFATTANIFFGEVDIGLTLVLAVGLMLGFPLGIGTFPYAHGTIGSPTNGRC